MHSYKHQSPDLIIFKHKVFWTSAALIPFSGIMSWILRRHLCLKLVAAGAPVFSPTRAETFKMPRSCLDDASAGKKETASSELWRTAGTFFHYEPLTAACAQTEGEHRALWICLRCRLQPLHAWSDCIRQQQTGWCSVQHRGCRLTWTQGRESLKADTSCLDAHHDYSWVWYQQ